ncbi:MAG: response regulator [Ignavibacteriaceae bacterium]|nr:response regulator [Ignavibacteriaceae bacterium]
MSKEKSSIQNHLNVLIVEDENIIAKDLSRIMKKFGYEVADIVVSGEEVITKAIQLRPDLIIMDVKLSGKMSGIEAADEIKKIIDIPIIYLTAYADAESIQKAKLTEPFAYIVKPFDEKVLHTSIEIAVHKHKIGKKLRERTLELEEEKKKSDVLIHNILPKQVVKELRETGWIKPREYKMVTLLFTDFQDFSTLSAQMTPNELVSELNEIFKHFDGIIDEFALEKLKIIGDSYMAGGGFPDESTDHAIRVVKAAILMQEFITERNRSSVYKWPMRLGVHSGNVVAGVIGKNKMTYDVWGTTVNIANRMESNGRVGKVNISSSTYNLVKDYCDCVFHDSLKINDKTKIDMYFVKSIK